MWFKLIHMNIHTPDTGTEIYDEKEVSSEDIAPTTIKTLGGEPLSFGRLHRDFAKTVYGQTLASNVRWETYKPAEISKAEWVKMLGADANNLEHMNLMYGMTRAFLRHEHTTAVNKLHPETPLTKAEREILLLTAVVHDWSEAITGDIPPFMKTDAFRKSEDEAFLKIAHECLDNILPPKTVGTIISTNTDKHNRIKIIFKVVEEVSFVRTAINAWRQSLVVQNGAAPSLINLCCNVFRYEIPVMIMNSLKHYAVREYLYGMAEQISEIYDKMPESAFEQYPEEKREKTKNEFMNAKKIWDDYRSRNLVRKCGPTLSDHTTKTA